MPKNRPNGLHGEEECLAGDGSADHSFWVMVMMTFETLAQSFTALSEDNWVPQRGWMYAGGDYTVVVGNAGYRGVFVETAKANWGELLDLMSAE